MQEKRYWINLIPMMGNMGYHYKADTLGIKSVNEGGIEYNDGSSQEAEISILFPGLAGT